MRIVTHDACVPGRLARGGGAALGGSALRAARCGKCIEASRRGWTVGAGASGPARRGQRIKGSASRAALRAARRGQRIQGSTSRAADRGQRVEGSASTWPPRTSASTRYPNLRVKEKAHVWRGTGQETARACSCYPSLRREWKAIGAGGDLQGKCHALVLSARRIAHLQPSPGRLGRGGTWAHFAKSRRRV